MKPTVKTSVTKDNVQSLVKAIQALARKDVLVGIPEQKTERNNEDGGPINNATLGYIHDNGSPIAGIPARPWLKPGIEDAKQPIAEHLKLAAEDALNGDESSAVKELHAAGLSAQNSVRNKINAGEFTPLAPATLAARRRRGHTSTKPLVETGQLRNAVTYVVRDKK